MSCSSQRAWQIGHLEILKLRFGNDAFAASEVILKDIAESKRTNALVQEKLRVKIKEETEAKAEMMLLQQKNNVSPSPPAVRTLSFASPPSSSALSPSLRRPPFASFTASTNANLNAKTSFSPSFSEDKASSAVSHPNPIQPIIYSHLFWPKHVVEGEERLNLPPPMQK